MTEAYMLIHDKGVVHGMFVVRERDLGYMDRRVVAYVRNGMREAVEALETVLSDRHVNIPYFREKAVEALKSVSGVELSVTDTLEFASKSKNRTVRDRTILGSENHKQYERMVVQVGIESVGRLRQRQSR